jgi:lipid II:glycine glycyltransferase (peptidoglycan interpeptide bridge formation enzyme)
LPSIPYIFFQSISSTLPKESLDFIFASLNGEYIAAWMILNYNGVMHLECYGGDNVAYENGASYLLSWECIKYAISLGLKKVSFGRTDCWNEGLLKYKRRWATLEEPICYYNYSYKHNAPFSFKSVKGRQTTRLIFRHAPHSIRKAIASIIYRHNG